MLLLYTTLLKTLFRARYGETPDPTAGREVRGLVLVADGVGGLDLCGTGLRHAIGTEGVPYLVEVVPWGHGLGRWHADLTNAVNRDLRAREVAESATAFRAERPGMPVFLVGKSGGTGVVVKALEHLPADAVEAAVLISPAISPSYDLSRALAAVRREMVVFWSPYDVFVLGAGTRIFGTIDRIRTVSAGLVGFRTPPTSADGDGDGDGDGEDTRRARYRKLRQVRWRPAMARTGYLGGHVGPDNPAFLRKYVVPLLRAGDVEIS
jgi:hypothetical protein